MDKAVNNSNRASAEAHFRARQILKTDAEQGRNDYYTAQSELLKRTERLRRQRLA